MKKFIIVKDEDTAMILYGAGFQLLSQIAGVYTFLNVQPARFDFSEIDQKKIVFSDVLCI